MDRRDIHDESMHLGHDAAWELDWERAAGYYNKALAEMPGSVDAMKALGLALLESGRHGQALSAYLRAAGADPGDPVAREKCAEIHEGLGHLKEALESWEAAADCYSRRRDVEKAIASWAHMARLAPGNLAVRSRLALTYERLGRRPRAMEEYLAIASILQQSGRPDRAVEAVQRALGLMPGEPTAGEAQRTLREGRLLPPPAAPRPHTSPLRTEEVTAYLSEDLLSSELGADDPEAEAQRVALQVLAGLLFEEPPQCEVAQIEKGGKQGKPDRRQASSRSQMVRFLTEAIDLQSRDEPAQAVQAYERAIAAGLDHPAARFIAGRLYKDLGQPEMARAHLEAGARVPDLALGANLALGRIARQVNDTPEAACHLLEALRLADSLSAAPGQTAQLDVAYEAIRASLDAEDSSSLTALVDQALVFLAGPGWRANVCRARESLNSQGETDGPGTIAEVIQNGGTDAVLQAMDRIEELMARGLYGSAMEEGYLTLDQAPHYLSLHLRMAEILLKVERIGPAVEKMKLVAATYRLRGQTCQATEVYLQVVALSPLDLALRTELIGLLTGQNRVDEAADQYFELHTLHRQMAEIEQARDALEHALELADTGTLGRARHLAILHSLADIDNSLLNWRAALGVYTQIRSLDPSNERARRECVELNLRLGQEEQAARDLDGLLEDLVRGGRGAEALQLLEETAREHSGRPSLHARLAEAYRAAGRTSDAIAQYDALGEIQLDAGAVVPAIRTIQIILSLNPPDGDSYRELLRNLEAGT